jgi:phenylpropionate dioxygenase-like ring-hydroxylating dioxygenase large terminal subunit
MKSYPFPAYPNSWYAVASSHDVRPGKVVPVRYFGRDLVVFRGEDGAPRVLDAYCPHLGAHLGVKSRVVGNTLECPFHAWRFDGAGACVSIPYAAKIPPRARTRGWRARDVNGAVMVHYHDRDEAPSFEVPGVEGFSNPGWTAPDYHSVRVRSHVQEMNENVFDVAHFVYIHHYAEMPEPTIDEDGPFARVRLKGYSRYAGLRFPSETVASIYGAGFLVIHVTRPIEFKVLVSKTPIDEETVEHRYAVVHRKRVPGVDWLVRRVISRQIIADVESDRSIWEQKIHLVKPILVKADAPIMRFRKWHAQFYSPAAAAPS